jgi:hypothetical protein
MPTSVRTLSLFLLLLLVSFPALADNGLASLGDALERLLILVFWLLGTAALMIVGLVVYSKRKTTAAAFLVYFSFVSLTALYAKGFHHFLENNGSMLFDDSIDTMEKDGAIAAYRILIGAGFVLAAGIGTFIVYHRRSKRRKTPRG